MKRRKAIGTILLGGTAVTLSIGGYEWYSLNRPPDKNYILSKRSLLAELAETIIPATDTPGAREAGAVDFMISFLNDCTDKKTLNRFIEGLKELEDHTGSRYHKEFIQCSAAEKEAILRHFEEKSAVTHSIFEKVKNKFTGFPFFVTLKKYAVHGYCISEKGATIGMRYIAVPGKNMACIPLEPNQKAWATN